MLHPMPPCSTPCSPRPCSLSPRIPASSISDSRLFPTSDIKSRISNLESQISDFKSQISNFESAIYLSLLDIKLLNIRLFVIPRLHHAPRLVLLLILNVRAVPGLFDQLALIIEDCRRRHTAILAPVILSEAKDLKLAMRKDPSLRSRHKRICDRVAKQAFVLVALTATHPSRPHALKGGKSAPRARNALTEIGLDLSIRLMPAPQKPSLLFGPGQDTAYL